LKHAASIFNRFTVPVQTETLIRHNGNLFSARLHTYDLHLRPEGNHEQIEDPAIAVTCEACGPRFGSNVPDPKAVRSSIQRLACFTLNAASAVFAEEAEFWAQRFASTVTSHVQYGGQFRTYESEEVQAPLRSSTTLSSKWIYRPSAAPLPTLRPCPWPDWAPQCDDLLQITAIFGELRQVVSNLMLNSLDALGESGRVTLRASRS